MKPNLLKIVRQRTARCNILCFFSVNSVFSDVTTGETTSHPTKQPEDGCQVVGYSHSTKLAKDASQVAGYVAN